MKKKEPVATEVLAFIDWAENSPMTPAFNWHMMLDLVLFRYVSNKRLQSILDVLQDSPLEVRHLVRQEIAEVAVDRLLKAETRLKSSNPFHIHASAVPLERLSNHERAMFEKYHTAPPQWGVLAPSTPADLLQARVNEIKADAQAGVKSKAIESFTEPRGLDDAQLDGLALVIETYRKSHDSMLERVTQLNHKFDKAIAQITELTKFSKALETNGDLEPRLSAMERQIGMLQLVLGNGGLDPAPILQRLEASERRLNRIEGELTWNDDAIAKPVLAIDEEDDEDDSEEPVDPEPSVDDEIRDEAMQRLLMDNKFGMMDEGN